MATLPLSAQVQRDFGGGWGGGGETERERVRERKAWGDTEKYIFKRRDHFVQVRKRLTDFSTKGRNTRVAKTLP